MDKIYFAKLKEDATIPSKRIEDGGYDVYACFEEGIIQIKPNETIMLPTGIMSAFPSKYVALLQERGSTGTKGIGQRAGVIDSGYRGEWHVPITNHNDKSLIIYKSHVDVSECEDHAILYPYEKAICQFVLVEVPVVEVEEVPQDFINAIASVRGTGMIGSSNK